jgi:hypothetical protein
MTLGKEATDSSGPLLEIELVEIINGCLARFRGDLVSETSFGLSSIEPMLANEAHVTLDVSAVRSIDGPGLEAVLRLVGTIHTFGGTVIFGSEPTSGEVDA